MPELPSNLTVHLGFLVLICAFLVRDILHLRLIAVLAYLGFIYGAAQHQAWEDAPHLYWYFVVLAINTVQSAILLYERSLLRLTDEEETLWKQAFPALESVAVKRILRRGEWVDLAPGQVMAREGEVPDYVVVLAGGAADVTLEDRPVARLEAGEFVGEIAFLSERPATATVVAGENVRALMWPRRRLRRWVDRDTQMHAAMYAAMGQNLAGKIAAASVAIARG